MAVVDVELSSVQPVVVELVCLRFAVVAEETEVELLGSVAELVEVLGFVVELVEVLALLVLPPQSFELP